MLDPESFHIDDDGETITVAKFANWLNNHDTVPFTLTEPHSYRGYYDCLGFTIDMTPDSADANRQRLLACVGKTLSGYKGGDFLMDEYTPVYNAVYGPTGHPVTVEWLDAITAEWSTEHAA